MENGPNQKLGTGCCDLNVTASRCSCFDSEDSTHSVEKSYNKKHRSTKKDGKDALKHVQYVGTLTMSDKYKYDDPVIQQVLKYVASIHSKLSKHSIAEKIGGNPQSWQYVVVKGKEGTKIICKLPSKKSTDDKPQSAPTEGTAKVSNHDDKLSYIFEKCSPKLLQKSCSSICSDCKNRLNLSTAFTLQLGDICPQCRKEEMSNNQFDRCSKCSKDDSIDLGEFQTYKKFLRNYHTTDNIVVSNKIRSTPYEDLCDACRAATPNTKLKTSTPKPISREMCPNCESPVNVKETGANNKLPSWQAKSITPDTCNECNLNQNGICLECGQYSLNQQGVKKDCSCEYKVNKSPFGSYTAGSLQSYQLNPEMGWCAECQEKETKQEIGVQHQSRVTSRGTCDRCKSTLDAKGICAYCNLQSLRPKDETRDVCAECCSLLDPMDMCDSCATTKDVCGKCQSNVDSMGICGFCKNYQPENNLKGVCGHRCYEFDGASGLRTNIFQPSDLLEINDGRQTTVSHMDACKDCGVEPSEKNNLSAHDIIGRLMEAYKACSCKVCECFSIKNETAAVTAQCQCTPCQCPDCTKLMSKRPGCVFATFPCFVTKNDDCTCKPCNCIRCTKAMTTSLCECEPCRCNMCTKEHKLHNNNFVVAQVGMETSRPSCSCAPCECISCRMNASLPVRRSRHEVSTDTAIFNNSDCLCDDCVSETCQSLAAGSCLCAGKNKVMQKPFGRLSNDFDIRTATVTKTDVFNNGKTKREAYATYAALTNNSPMFLNNKKTQENNVCRGNVGNKSFNKISTKNSHLNTKNKEHNLNNEFNAIKENLIKIQKNIVKSNDSGDAQRKNSSSLEMSGSTLISSSLLSEECSSTSTIDHLLDITKPQKDRDGHKSNRNNINITLYAKTYANPLQHLKDTSQSSETKPSSSQVTHTSSYTDYIPTKDETDSCEFGYDKEVKTRTKSASNGVSKGKIVEEYYVPISKSKRLSELINPTYTLSQNICDTETYTSSSCNKLSSEKDICSSNNKSSISTNISKIKTSEPRHQQNKSTQHHSKTIKKCIKINESKYNVTKIIVNDAHTNTSNTHTIVVEDEVPTASKKLEKSSGLTSLTTEIPSCMKDLEIYKKYKSKLSGMYELSPAMMEPYPKCQDSCSKWIKDNDLVLKRIDFDALGNDDPYQVTPSWNKEYKKAQNMLDNARTFSNQLINILQVFESINEEFLNVSAKIDVFNGRISSDLSKLKELINSTEMVIPNNITFHFPLLHGKHSFPILDNKISVYKPNDINPSAFIQEEAKFKHVSFNNINPNSVRTYTNEEYEKLNNKTELALPAETPVFQETQDKFLVYNVSKDTIEIINVDNQKTFGEVPFDKENFASEPMTSSSIVELCNAIENITDSTNRKDDLINELLNKTSEKCDNISTDNDLSNVADYCIDFPKESDLGLASDNTETIKNLDEEVTQPFEYKEMLECEDAIEIPTSNDENAQSDAIVSGFVDKRSSPIKVIENPIDEKRENLDDDIMMVIKPQEVDICEVNNLITLATEFKEDLPLQPDDIDNEIMGIIPRGENHIYVQTSVRQFDLRDVEISCSNRDLFDICTYKSSIGDRESAYSFIGTHSRDFLDFMPKPIPRKTTCEYLKVSDLGVKRLSNHTVVVKWEKPMAFNQVCGYELLVDGKPVDKSLSPSSCMAVLRCLPPSETVLITVKTKPKVNEFDHHPSSTVVYSPRVK